MAMSVYLTLKSSSSSKDVKMEGERSKAICVPVSLARQKQMLTLKKLVIVQRNCYLSIRAVADLGNIDNESFRQILHEHFNMKQCA
jgi:hypothetical protein